MMRSINLISKSTWAAIGLLLLPTTMVYAKPWSIELRNWSATRFENPEQKDSASISRSQLRISHQWLNERTHPSLSYNYQPVLIRDESPAQNGYLHRVDLSLRFRQGSTQFEFTSGVHGSSNMFKHFEFHHEALVSTFGIMHVFSSDRVRLGINGDYRFGHFRMYPRAILSKALSGNGELILDIPLGLVWRNSRWRFGVTAYGEKWAALDSKSKTESAFYLNEWRLGGRWRVTQSSDKVVFQLGAGVSFNTQVHYLDLVGGWREKDLESAAFIELAMDF